MVQLYTGFEMSCSSLPDYWRGLETLAQKKHTLILGYNKGWTNVIPTCFRHLAFFRLGYRSRTRATSLNTVDTMGKWNESCFRPPLCTYRLNWARRTSWGWWDDWDDTVLQTQDSKFEPWRSEAEHATSRSRRLPTILTFTRGWGRNIFCFFQTAETGNRTPNYPRAPARYDGQVKVASCRHRPTESFYVGLIARFTRVTSVSIYLYFRHWSSPLDQLILTTRGQRFHSHSLYCRIFSERWPHRVQNNSIHVITIDASENEIKLSRLNIHWYIPYIVNIVLSSYF